MPEAQVCLMLSREESAFSHVRAHHPAPGNLPRQKRRFSPARGDLLVRAWHHVILLPFPLLFRATAISLTSCPPEDQREHLPYCPKTQKRQRPVHLQSPLLHHRRPFLLPLRLKRRKRQKTLIVSSSQHRCCRCRRRYLACPRFCGSLLVIDPLWFFHPRQCPPSWPAALQILRPSELEPQSDGRAVTEDRTASG